jgi:hypothetical protein
MSFLLQPNADGSPGAYDVFHRALRIGQIYKREAALRPEGQWIWSLNGVPDGPGGPVLAGSAESLEGAEAALRERWEQWLAWAGLSEDGGAAL